MNLKTLKDLEIYKTSVAYGNFDYEEGKRYAKEWVKQEAIKWIKELRKRREPEITSHSTDVIEDFDVERIIEKSGTKTGSVYCKKCGKMLWASYNEIMQTMVETDDGFYCVKCFKLEEVNEKGLSENILVRWIKHFFNITEEDLK